LAVNIEQFGNGCILALNGLGRFLMNAAESLRERIADSGDALGAHSWESPKPAVMRRGFKFLQAFDAQILVELPRGYLADAGHRSKQCKRVCSLPSANGTDCAYRFSTRATEHSTGISIRDPQNESPVRSVIFTLPKLWPPGSMTIRSPPREKRAGRDCPRF
jgi:hypothetical protein